MKVRYFSKAFEYDEYIIGGDVGGTNTNLAVFGAGKKPIPLFSLDFQTDKLDSLIPALRRLISFCRKHGISISRGCLGVAGPVVNNKCKPTYVKWVVDALEIKQKTGLDLLLINDFVAIGYGINMLQNKDIIEVSKGKKALPKATKAVIGAGTGLGKTILTYREGSYIPIPSEGGFCDFPVFDDFELGLLNSIKKRKKMGVVSMEEVISGKGIESIYLYIKDRFKPTRYSNVIMKAKHKIPLIAKYKADKACKETFRLYAKFYARCAKNFALDSLSRGGLYIAGGIAMKNHEIFNKAFIFEFRNINRQQQVLKRMPIYLINNYDVGIYGAAYAAQVND